LSANKFVREAIWEINATILRFLEMIPPVALPYGLPPQFDEFLKFPTVRSTASPPFSAVAEADRATISLPAHFPLPLNCVGHHLNEECHR